MQKKNTHFSKFPISRMGFLLLGISGILVLGITQLSQYFSQTAEDAYILFRFAENLGNGFGIVSFPGSSPQEGASSMSLLLLLALTKAMGWAVPQWSKVFGIASLLGSLWLLFFWGKSCIKKSIPLPHANLLLLFAVLASLLLPIEIAIWTTAGLETLQTAFLFLFLAFAIWKSGDQDGTGIWIWTAFILAFVAANTRPEGLLYALATLPLILLLRFTRGSNPKKALGSLLPAFGLLLFLETLVLLFKYFYFGSIWSNPAFVKLSVRSWLNPGAYLLSFLQARGPFFWLFLGILFLGLFHGIRQALRGRLTSLTRALLVAWAFVLMQVFVVFYTGGDYMAFHRFLVPAFPAIAAASIFFSLDLKPKFRFPSLILLPLALGASGFGGNHIPLDAFSGLLTEQNPPRCIRAVKKLRDTPQKDSPYAISECGYIPYHVKGPFLDLMGLNNKIIARSYKLYGIEGGPTAARDWILSQLPWAIVSFDYWKENEKLKIGDGIAWFFGPYFQSLFFKKYWDLQREIPKKRNEELLFSYFKGSYKGSHDLKSKDRKNQDLFMFGFYFEPDKIWTSPLARILLKPRLGDRQLHIEGWIPSLGSFPNHRLHIGFYTEGFAIGSKRFAEGQVRKEGIFQIKVPLPKNAGQERNFLLTLRGTRKTHPKGSKDARDLSWVFRRVWTTK
jgi:hypothetical protein